MNQYVMGSLIRRLREERGLTQAALAEALAVSDKAVSKWETGKGYPDITLVEPIAAALGVSTAELLAGSEVTNRNRAANMARVRIYVCPICGNVIASVGEAMVSCCGITLPPAEETPADEDHALHVEVVEDEYFVTLDHPMTKEHHVSFIAAVRDNSLQLVKLYPEGPCEAAFKISRTQRLLAYCNHHGLFAIRKPFASKR